MGRRRAPIKRIFASRASADRCATSGGIGSALPADEVNQLRDRALLGIENVRDHERILAQRPGAVSEPWVLGRRAMMLAAEGCPKREQPSANPPPASTLGPSKRDPPLRLAGDPCKLDEAVH